MLFRSFVLAACLPLVCPAVAPACSLCGSVFGHVCQMLNPFGGDPAAGIPNTAAEAAAADGQEFGFMLSGRQWSQPGGDGSPITLTYSYNNFLDGGLLDPDGVPVPEDFLRTVTEEAFGLWASVAPISFVEVPDIGTPISDRRELNAYRQAYNRLAADTFGDIRLSHWFRDGPDTPSRALPKAEAFFPQFNRVGGDIFFDNGDPWAVIGTSSEPDVLGILTHEIGHSLGIGHSTIEGSVMFPMALRRNGPGTGLLTADDIAAVRAIYGEGTGTVTPLVSVPEPTSLALVLIACWCGSPRRRVHPTETRFSLSQTNQNA